MHRNWVSWLILVSLLAIQAAIAMRPHSGAFSGDEPYYVDKAKQWATRHAFDPASPDELAVERGERWGTADWRPPGYPVAIALMSGGNFEPSTLRTRVTAVQFIAIAAVLLTAFGLFGRGAPVPAAFLLGVAVWPFEYVSSIVPDALTAALTFLGVVTLWRAVSTRRAATAFAGALLTAATLLLRPEAIAVAFVTTTVALLLVRFDVRLAAAAAAAFLLVCGLHYAYRIEFTGERFPPFFSALHTRSLGAMHWVNTRLLTEHQGLEDIVYALGEGRQPRIPPRAIANARERQEIDAALAMLRRDNGNSAAVDGTFERLAYERVREAPLCAGVLPRLAHVGQLWINLYTNSQTLSVLVPVPRPVRIVILLALLSLKCAAVALFGAAAVTLIRGWRTRDARWMLIALLATVVIVRTLLIGVVLNVMEHRYVTSVWPALLACACAAMSTKDRAQEMVTPASPCRAAP